MALILLFLTGLILSIALCLGSLYQHIAFLDALCGAQTDNIERLLKRRHNMLDELIQALRAFTVNDHENLELIVKIHSDALRALSPNARLLAERRLDECVRRLLQHAREIPLLTLSNEFSSFHCEMQRNENALNASRLALSGLIRDYNKTLKRFPINQFAARFNYTQWALYDIGGDGDELIEAYT
jgi:LemA protein